MKLIGYLGAMIAATCLASAPASACFSEIKWAKMFDREPPAHDGVFIVEFEMLKHEGVEMSVRLKSKLGDHNAGDAVRFLAPWSSCVDMSERWGSEFGAVSLWQDRDGELVYFLHTYEFRDEGLTRSATGAPRAPGPQLRLTQKVAPASDD